jgi:hypothetical protein
VTLREENGSSAPGDPDRPLSVTDLAAIGLAAPTATAVVDPLLH